MLSPFTEACFSAFYSILSGFQACLRHLVLRLCALKITLRDYVALEQLALAVELELGADQICPALRHVGTRLRDVGLCLLDLSRVEVGLDPCEKLTLRDTIALADRQFDDLTRDVRADLDFGLRLYAARSRHRLSDRPHDRRCRFDGVGAFTAEPACCTPDDAEDNKQDDQAADDEQYAPRG